MSEIIKKSLINKSKFKPILIVGFVITLIAVIAISGVYALNTYLTKKETPKVVMHQPKDNSKELLSGFSHIVNQQTQQNELLIDKLNAQKGNLITKDNLKDLISSINQNNQSLANEQKNYTKEFSDALSKLNNKIDLLTKSVTKSIQQTPVTVSNNDFYISSIVWINGSQIVDVHDRKLNQNISMSVGQSYDGWDLLAIDDHDCVSFKNNVGINKQCL
ncbi:hypothetical protein [Francisella sp. SYW-9]|uniref:hypothetical protein n=2 Tax=Thiotrichales TaxID=72273 RepID=UPI00123DEF17|nr:hypothetical protein [Francisella sp. SYW-9]